MHAVLGARRALLNWALRHTVLLPVCNRVQWTVMAYMIEGGGSKNFSKAKTWLYKYPDATVDLLDRLTASNPDPDPDPNPNPNPRLPHGQ